jgi:hypothetical protein
MKRFAIWSMILTLLMSLSSVASAQYQHPTFFNGGTSLTATCNAISGSILASDIELGTLQGNMTQWISHSQRPKLGSRINGYFATWTRLGPVSQPIAVLQNHLGWLESNQSFSISE